MTNLCTAVDEGTIDIDAIISDVIIDSYYKGKDDLLRKIQAYSLIKSTDILSHEDSIEAEIEKHIKHYTLIGQNELAQYNLSKFVSYSTIAINNQTPRELRDALKKTGLSFQSGYKLYKDVLDFWSANCNTQLAEINEGFVRQVGEMIFSIKETKPEVSKKALPYMGLLLSEWIFNSNNSYQDYKALINKFHKYIGLSTSLDIELQAEKFYKFRNNTLSYKSPWGLSSFYILSEYVLRSKGIDLKSLPINESLSCLPSYAKFGVSKLSAALFCSLGLKSSFASTKLALMYESFFGQTNPQYSHMLSWFLDIHDQEGNEISLRELEIDYGFSTKEVKKIRDAQKELEIWNISSDDDKKEIVITEGVYLTSWKYFGSDIILNNIQEGDIGKIELDSNNTYDETAIKVNWNNTIVGYIPSLYTRSILNYIQNGDKINVTFTGVLKNNNYKALKVKIVAEISS